MEKELLAALMGGAVGVAGSLVSVGLGFYGQRRVVKEQLEAERERHKEQLETERSLHNEQLKVERERHLESISRDNKFRELELLGVDLNYFSNVLDQKGSSSDTAAVKYDLEHRQRDAAQRVTEIQGARNRIMKELGLFRK